MYLDLNCDLGEGCAHDAELMPLVTSANVACGGHAGDLETTLATLELAATHGVQVGAHPGFLDRASFGRLELPRPPERVYLVCLAQTQALVTLARIPGVAVRYLKPHGALYNMACREATVAEPVVRVAEELGLAVMGLPGSALSQVAAGRVPFVAEGFADRRYRPDGSLVPRTDPRPFVETLGEAVAQARRLLTGGVATLCVHGDNHQAVAFVRGLRDELATAGVTPRAFTAG